MGEVAIFILVVLIFWLAPTALSVLAEVNRDQVVRHHTPAVEVNARLKRVAKPTNMKGRTW